MSIGALLILSVFLWEVRHNTIRDAIFNVRSKADTSQLNLQLKTAKTEEEKLKRKNGYAQK